MSTFNDLEYTLYNSIASLQVLLLWVSCIIAIILQERKQQKQDVE